MAAADELSSPDGGGARLETVYRNIKRSIMDSTRMDRIMSLDLASATGRHSAVKSEPEASCDDEEDEISVGCPSPPPPMKQHQHHRRHHQPDEVASRVEDADACSRLSVNSCCSSSSGAPSSPESPRPQDALLDCSPSCGKLKYATSDDDEEDCRLQRHRHRPAGSEEYFKPLKKLKMTKIDKTSFSINEKNKHHHHHHHHQHHHHHRNNNNNNNSGNGGKRFHRKAAITQCPQPDPSPPNPVGGVKSFSISDILSHKPNKVSSSSSSPPTTATTTTVAATTPPSATAGTATKIVRPWVSAGPAEEIVNPYLLPPPAHRGIIVPHQVAAPLFFSQFHHQQLAAAAALHFRPKSEDISSTYESCSSSGRSSTGGSDCCTSPDVVINCSNVQAASVKPNHLHHHHRHHSNSLGAGSNVVGRAAVKSTENNGSSGASAAASRHHHKSSGSNSTSAGGKQANSSPLDALFQMTNKTFDELNGEPGTEGGNHLNLFNNRQQPKKKRKSRTAFTNLQIFELEKRFLCQKYLSPADRDEIAAQLGLSNAQVITWFQNRRAKMKRDFEEMKKDVETSHVLSQHNTFLEKVQNLGILKKKPAPLSHLECKNSESEK